MKTMKHELQNVISGKSEVRHGTAIQAISGYLRRSNESGKLAKDSKQYKKQEAQVLRDYIISHSLWIPDILQNYISEGAEQRVFLYDGKNVVKLNDSIFYSSWEDYFYSLLLHNYFFPDTSYELMGFREESGNLYAVVKQAFIKSTELTDLENVRSFMQENGFINTKNNDYHHPHLGIILEDLHDENVLTKSGVLHFVDTVFYITNKFYETPS